MSPRGASRRGRSLTFPIHFARANRARAEVNGGGGTRFFSFESISGA